MWNGIAYHGAVTDLNGFDDMEQHFCCLAGQKEALASHGGVIYVPC